MATKRYMKKRLTEEDIDKLRISLSGRDLKLSPEPVCDFCGDGKPVWAYAAVRASTGEWVKNWRWLACGRCGAAVDVDVWGIIEGKLVRRLARVFPELPRLALLAVVKTALLEFQLYAETDDENGTEGK